MRTWKVGIKRCGNVEKTEPHTRQQSPGKQQRRNCRARDKPARSDEVRHQPKQNQTLAADSVSQSSAEDRGEKSSEEPDPGKSRNREVGPARLFPDKRNSRREHARVQAANCPSPSRTSGLQPPSPNGTSTICSSLHWLLLYQTPTPLLHTPRRCPRHISPPARGGKDRTEE